MLHAARTLHGVPVMLGAPEGARQLFQAGHRDRSTWGAARRAGAGGAAVLAAHGEGGHQVGAPAVRRVVRSPRQASLLPWGAG